MNKKKRKRKPNWSRIIPWSMSLILFICITVVILRLLIWNAGEKIVITDEDIAKIQLDTSDNITILPPSLFRPDTDDGIPTIAVFGNDSYYEGIDNSTSIMDYVGKEIPEAVIYNFCLPNSSLTATNFSELSPEECPEEYFSFYWLMLSKKLDEFDRQDKALHYLDSDKYDVALYSDTLSKIKALDLDSVDVILICYDGHEYLNGVAGVSEAHNDFETFNSTTTLGALSTSVYIVNDGYPDIQYVYLSPVFCYANDKNGKNVACDKYDTGNGSIATQLLGAREASNFVGVSYMDLFVGVDINEDTAKEYLENDGITPNEKARQLIADRIVKLLAGRLVIKEKDN